MSVPESQRGHGKFETLIKAKELAVYTCKICTNKNVFPVQYQNALTDKIIDTAMDIFMMCDTANNVRFRFDLKDDEYKLNMTKRQLYQVQACENCDRLLSLIQIAQPIFHLSTRRIQYWGGKAVEVKNLIWKWKESDRKRFGNYL